MRFDLCQNFSSFSGQLHNRKLEVKLISNYFALLLGFRCTMLLRNHFFEHVRVTRHAIYELLVVLDWIKRLSRFLNSANLLQHWFGHFSVNHTANVSIMRHSHKSSHAAIHSVILPLSFMTQIFHE